MPLYSIIAPNGKTYKIEGPEGASEAEVASAVMALMPDEDFNTPKEEQAGVFDSLKKGVESTLSGIATGAQGIFSPEEAAKRSVNEGQRIGAEYGYTTSLDKVKEAYSQAGEGLSGILAGGAEALSQVPGAIAEQVPQLGAMLAGGKAGAAVGSLAGPVGTVVGGTLGALAPSFLQIYGSNLGRQEQEGQDIEALKAAGAAAPAAALDLVAGKITLGKTLWSKALGIPEKELAGKAAETAVREGILKAATKGAGKSAATEIPTEVVQQGLERLQAGLPLADDEAFAEYADAGYAALLASPIGAAGGVADRASTGTTPTPLGVDAPLNEIEQKRIANRQRREQEALLEENVKREAKAKEGENLLRQEEREAVKLESERSKQIQAMLSEQDAAKRQARMEELQAAFPSDYSDVTDYATLVRERAAVEAMPKSKERDAIVKAITTRTRQLDREAATPAPVAPTEEEILTPEQMARRQQAQEGFDGVGQQELFPLSRDAVVAEQEQAQPPVQSAAPAAPVPDTVLTKDILVSMGFPKQSVIVKRYADTDLANADVQMAIAADLRRARENTRMNQDAVNTLANTVQRVRKETDAGVQPALTEYDDADIQLTADQEPKLRKQVKPRDLMQQTMQQPSKLDDDSFTADDVITEADIARITQNPQVFGASNMPKLRKLILGKTPKQIIADINADKGSGSYLQGMFKGTAIFDRLIQPFMEAKDAKSSSNIRRGRGSSDNKSNSANVRPDGNGQGGAGQGADGSTGSGVGVRGGSSGVDGRRSTVRDEALAEEWDDLYGMDDVKYPDLSDDLKTRFKDAVDEGYASAAVADEIAAAARKNKRVEAESKLVEKAPQPEDIEVPEGFTPVGRGVPKRKRRTPEEIVADQQAKAAAKAKREQEKADNQERIQKEKEAKQRAAKLAQEEKRAKKQEDEDVDRLIQAAAEAKSKKSQPEKKPAKPAKPVKAEKKVEQEKPARVRTTAEKAQDDWQQFADKGAPAWDTLDEGQRKEWVAAVKEDRADLFTANKIVSDRAAKEKQGIEDFQANEKAASQRKASLKARAPFGGVFAKTEGVQGHPDADPAMVGFVKDLSDKITPAASIYVIPKSAVNSMLADPSLTSQARSALAKDAGSSQAPGAVGTMSTYQELGFGILVYDETATQDMLVETVAHEYGHFVEKTVLAEAPSATRDAIMADYLEWSKKAKDPLTTVGDLVDMLRNRVGSARTFDKNAGMMGTPAKDAMGTETYKYFTSFSEWFADNVSRWATSTNKVPQSIVEKFFKGLADKLKQILKLAKKNKYPPAKSVADFMDEVYTVGKRRQDALLDSVVGNMITEIVERKKQTDSPAFKNWFGDSKVVDENSEPLVVYHASTAFEGNSFKPSLKVNRGSNMDGYYFASRVSRAESFVSDYDRETGEDSFRQGAEVSPYYLAINNPYRVGVTKPNRAMIDRLQKSLRDNGYNEYGVQEKTDAFKRGFIDPTTLANGSADYTEIVKAGGFDGAIDGDDWIAFAPNQIKSAIGNQGTFDPLSPSINEMRTDIEGTTQADLDAMKDAAGSIAPVRRTEEGTREAVEKGIQKVLAPSRSTLEFRVKAVDRSASVADKISRFYGTKLQDSLRNLNPLPLLRQAEAASRLMEAVFDKGGAAFDAVGNIFKAVEVKVTDPTSSLDAGTPASVKGMFTTIKAFANARGLSLADAEGYMHRVFEGRRYKWMKVQNVKTQATAAKMKGDDAQKYLEDNIMVLPTNIDVDAMIAQSDKAFRDEDYVRQYDDIMRAVREHAVQQAMDAGVLSKEQGAQWMQATEYVPFNRLDADSDQKAVNMVARGLTSFSNIRKLVGSETKPIGNISDNFANTIGWLTSQTLRNKAAQQIIVELEAQDYARKMKGPKDFDDKDAVVRILEGGKETYYELADPLDVNAFASIPMVKHPAMKVLQNSTRFLRASVTLMPQFAISQVIQDAQRAAFHSGAKSPFKVMASTLVNFPVVLAIEALGPNHSFVRGIKAMQKKANQIQALKDSGVVGQYDLNPVNPAENIRYDTGLERRSGFNKFLKAAETFTTASDMAARLAVFEQIQNDFPNGAVRAQVAARELINFNRRGSSSTVGFLITAIPFFNAYMQSMDLLYRNFKSGVDTGSGLSKAEMRSHMVKTGAMMFGIGLAYAMMMQDDEEYKKTPDVIKDRNWILPGGIAIPMPPELGLFFKVIPERMVQYYQRSGTDEEQAASEAVGQAFKSMFNAYASPNPTPQLVKPLLEAWTNYSFFTGRPIVPQSMQDIEPWLQYGSETSTFAMQVGKMFNVAPLMVDQVVSSTFGMAGTTAVQLVDAMTTDRGDRPLYRYPLISTFVKSPEGSQYVNEFYDFREKTARVKRSFDKIAETDPDAAMAYLEKGNNADLYAYDKYVTKVLKELSEIRKYRKFVQETDTMTGEEKRREIDAMDALRNELIADIREIKADSSSQ